MGEEEQKEQWCTNTLTGLTRLEVKEGVGCPAHKGKNEQGQAAQIEEKREPAPFEECVWGARAMGK
jgi:hypothetical protein